MATYRVEGNATLRTTVEPSGYLSLDRADEFEDTSRHDYHDVESDASFSFVIRASNEDEAESEALTLAENGLYFSGDDLEWELDNVSITSVERESREFTPEEAIVFIREWLADFEGVDDDVKDAFDTLFSGYTSTASRVDRLLAEVTALRAAAEAVPFVAGEAPTTEEVTP